jgi:cold shock CspA family protein
MPAALGPSPHCGDIRHAGTSVVTHGVVTDFDDAAGLGTITADDGTHYPFQCTQVADGTRTIAPGTAVAFEVRPWHGGRYEATAIRNLPGP